MSDRVVVVTGASSGIGAELSRILSARGDSVVLAARRKARLEEVAASCPSETLVVTADVSSRIDVRRVVTQTLDHFDHVDVWVNNAGLGISRKPTELTDEDVDTMVSVNVKSVLYGMQEILPHFRERGRGQIVNVSSMLGRIPYVTLRSAYCGAKHFVNALTACFRAEVKETHPDIVFSLVSPGVVHTDFGNNAMHGGPDSRSFPDGQPVEEVAAVLAQVIEDRRPDVYTRAGYRDAVVKYYGEMGVDP